MILIGQAQIWLSGCRKLNTHQILAPADVGAHFIAAIPPGSLKRGSTHVTRARITLRVMHEPRKPQRFRTHQFYGSGKFLSPVELESCITFQCIATAKNSIWLIRKYFAVAEKHGRFPVEWAICVICTSPPGKSLDPEIA
jgi:hypothetical protein